MVYLALWSGGPGGLTRTPCCTLFQTSQASPAFKMCAGAWEALDGKCPNHWCLCPPSQQSPCKNVLISSLYDLFSCSVDPKHSSSSAGPSRRKTSGFSELSWMMSSSGISVSCTQSTFLEPASVHMQSRSVKLLAGTLWFPADVTLNLDRHLHAGCENLIRAAA